MLNDRRIAANSVAEKLFELEVAIDHALACAGQLTSSLPEARIRAKLSAVVGQEAIGQVGEAVAALYAARSKTVTAHNSLAEVHEQIGLKTYASGMLWKAMADTKQPLELVRTKAA